jgi:hypothetical protein
VGGGQADVDQDAVWGWGGMGMGMGWRGGDEKKTERWMDWDSVRASKK